MKLVYLCTISPNIGYSVQDISFQSHLNQNVQIFGPRKYGNQIFIHT